MFRFSPQTWLRLIITPTLLALISLIAFLNYATPPTESVDAVSTVQPKVRGRDLLEPASDNPTPSPTPASSGTIFLSAERSARWEIYAAHPGSSWSQITNGFSPARAPALSPDGKILAFQSHKDGNWEIYSLRLDTGETKRLTNDLAYDGAPSWSPDGKQIAFESFRSGDLDIWVMNADGSNPINLTPNEPAYDFSPAWSPQGNQIAYASWSTGRKQILLVSPDGKQHLNLSSNSFEDEQPAWSPDGKRLAFVSNREACDHPSDTAAESNCQRREIYTADFDGSHLANVKQITFDGHDSAPVWSPDGSTIAFVSPRPSRQPLFLIPSGGGTPQPLSDQPMWIGSAAWATSPVSFSTPPVAYDPLYIEQPIPAPADSGHPYQLREMTEIYLAPSWGLMSSRVSTSFLTLRARVKQVSGNDFLAVLADMTRDPAYSCDVHCDNLSWHKSGRAVDTRLEYYDSVGRSIIELVREDELGEVYWRLYLRAAVQDGSMGEPIDDATWDYSSRARVQVAPGLGGIESPPPAGYYIDFTELAREYGWERISSHDDPTFDWRSNILAMEYWHYQKTDGMDWYPAISEIYPASQLGYNFDWNKIEQQWGTDEMRLFFKKVPAPSSAWKWFALLPDPARQP